MAQYVATIPDFSQSSSWYGYNELGDWYYSNPTTSTVNKAFDLSAIPSGSIITGASLVATIGSPWTGAEIRRVDGTTFYTPRDVTSKIQALNGIFSSPVTFEFKFKANGDAGSVSTLGDYHSASQTYANIQLIITYDPPASTGSLTLSTVDIGQTIRLQTIVAQNTSYTHKARWKLLGAGEQVQTLTAGVTYTDFTLPASWYSLLPSAISGAATCTLETYDGSTLLGSNAYSFTATVDASIIPAISSLAATPYSDTSPAVPAGWNLYVKNKSKAAISASIAAGTGASIQTVKVEGAGFTGWALPYTTGLLTTVGDFTFTVTVTDTRGRQKVQTVGITVTNYASPSASGVAFSRAATNGGAPDLNGTYIRGIATLAYSAIGTNTMTTKAYYRQMGTSTWYPAGGMTVVSATAYWMGGGTINVAYPYEVKLVLADALTKIEITGVIPTALRFWDFRADRAALGRFATNTKQFALPDDWDILHKGQTLDARYAKAGDLTGYLSKAGGTMTGTLTLPSSLTVLAEGGNEGGQILLAKAPSYSREANLDVYADTFRVHSGGSVRFSVDLTNGLAVATRIRGILNTSNGGSGDPTSGEDGDLYFKTS